MTRRYGGALLAPARGATIAALVLASIAIARADAPIPHEYVPDVEADEGTMLVSSGGPEPEALVYDGEVIPAPQGGALRSGEEHAMEAMPGSDQGVGEAGRRSPSFRPDRVTELNGEVGYYEVFTPAISPFKRVTALDGIAVAPGSSVPVLAVADRGPRRVEPVVGTQSPPPDGRARDLFWGSVVVDFTHGREVPFPSVSPESRILTARVDGGVRVRFERDGADNFFVVLDEPPAGVTEVRIVFLTDAPRTYFATSLPSVPANALEHEVAEVPPRVARRALQFASERLGLRPGMPFDHTLEELTRWFRDFEESAEPPRDTGDIYWDLANGQRGVCRHRAYAFVITAQALGIHARFVQNEAHAWVEVRVPEHGGWMRIDLGGSPRGLAPRNADDRPSYRSETPDPLPRPERYVEAYREAARARAEREGGGASAAAGGAGAGRRSARGGEDGARGEPAAMSAPPRAEVEEGTAREERAALDLHLDVPPMIDVLRGGIVPVSGIARSGDLGVAGLRIEVLLSAERGGSERLLGVTVTNEHGAFRTTVGVPPDVAVGDYRLVVRSPGDARVRPAMAY